MALGAFAIRRRDLGVYLIGESAAQEALGARLGKRMMGRSCLWVPAAS